MSTPILRYAVGEWPEPIDYQFLDSDGTAIPLTGFTPTATITNPAGTVTSYDGEVAVTNAAGGVVTFTWPDSTLTSAGDYRLMIWVTSSSNRFASDPITVVALTRGGIPAP